MSFKPSSEDYFSELRLKPGFHLYRELAINKTDPTGLKVRIPETIVGIENSQALLFTDDSGKLVRRTDVGYSEFENLLMTSNSKFCSRINVLSYYIGSSNCRPVWIREKQWFAFYYH